MPIAASSTMDAARRLSASPPRLIEEVAQSGSQWPSQDKGRLKQPGARYRRAPVEQRHTEQERAEQSRAAKVARGRRIRRPISQSSASVCEKVIVTQ